MKKILKNIAQKLGVYEVLSIERIRMAASKEFVKELEENAFAKAQLEKPTQIPIIIISYNQFFYLKQLIDSLQSRGYLNIVIIDNASTYPPLLNYLKEIENDVTIHRLTENKGHMVFWKEREIFEKYAKGFYVITDADVVLIPECPDDFMDILLSQFMSFKSYTKIGLSLKLDDIPDENIAKKEILDWEKQFWQKRKGAFLFEAEVDTTFAIYRPKYMYDPVNFFDSLRMNFPIQGKHGGWYIDQKNLTEEQKYYYATANSSSSWLLNEAGELENAKYRKKKN